MMGTFTRPSEGLDLVEQPRRPGHSHGPDWIPAASLPDGTPAPEVLGLPEAPDPDSWLARNPDRKPGDLRVTVGVLALGALVTLLAMTGALTIFGLLLDTW